MRLLSAKPKRFALNVLMPLVLCSASASALADASVFACQYEGGLNVRCVEADTGAVILVPLYAEAFDRARVQQLTRAVMCGGVANCRVEFASDPITLARLDPVELVDRTDAALND